MIEEENFVPFAASAPEGSRWLIIAPHADDETFGMGGTIALGRQQGIEVTVLVMTDGALGGEVGSGLAARRRREVTEALTRLGGGEVAFRNLPDRGVCVDPEQIDWLSETIGHGRYSHVFFPMPGEPHPDHRACALLTWEALRQGGFPALPVGYEISLQSTINRLVDITPVLDAKRQAMQAFESQNAERPYIDRVLGLNASRSWSLGSQVSHAEGFFHWKPQDQPLERLWQQLRCSQRIEPATSRPRPLVSVLIRTCNRPALLSQAVDSVVAQDWPRIELVVVNDGTEPVEDWLVEKCASGGLPLAIESSGGRGRAAAANMALEAAGGDLMLFLDDDDLIEPNHVSTLTTQLMDQPESIGAHSDTSAGTFDETGAWRETMRFDRPFNPLRLGHTNHLPIHAVLFRRMVVDSGCRFPESLDHYEDWAFWLQVARLGSIVHVPSLTARYQVSEDHGFGARHQGRQDATPLQRFAQQARTLWTDEQLVELLRRAADHERLSGEATALRQQNHELENELAARSQLINELTTSISWRLTAGLRWLKRRLGSKRD